MAKNEFESPIFNDKEEKERLVREQKAAREKEVVMRYYQRFRQAQVAVQSKHQLWKMLDMFDRGEQWKNVSIPPWIPRPVTNYIRYIRTLKRANLSSAIPKTTFVAEYPEDKEFVDRLQKAHDHVWEQQNISRLVRECIDRALLQGTAIAYLYTEDGIYGKYYGENNPRNRLYQGKICVKRIPIVNFFPDPDAYSLDQCKFIEVTEILPLSQIKNNKNIRKYLEKEGTLYKLDNLKNSQLEMEDSASGTVFNRDNKPTDNALGNLKGDEMVTLHCHWERYLNEKGEWQLDVTYYLRDTDFILYRIEDVKPSEYPFAVLYDEPEENDFWGTSTCMDIFENQKIINKTAQTASIIGVLHQNPQKIVSRESGINAQELARTGTLPGKVWTSNMDPARSIHIVQPPDIPRGLFELEDRMKSDIREIAGVNEAYTGESVGSLTTSTGVNSLIERATVRDKDKMVNIDAFVERLSHLIALFILYKWKDKRPIMTIGPNGEPQYEEYEPIKNESDIRNIMWRVRSDVYAKAPLTQAAKRQQADHLMQLQGQFNFNPPIITPEEWIRFQDFDIKEEILQRMERDRLMLEQQRPQMLADQIIQVAQVIADGMAQGLPMQEVQSMAMETAQQIVEMQNQLVQQLRPRDARKVNAPQGVTGQIAMANMARGY